MKLVNEFTVAVPLERSWETLLDIERVAGFLPGATIEPGAEDGTYAGRMRVKLGPMVINYQGTVRLVEVDEANHTVRMAVEAKEAKGQGTASATILNRVMEADGGTRVVAETDLAVTGRQAQFGRGIMQDVAGRMLGQFARRFEEHLTAGGETPAAEAETAAQPAATQTAAGQPSSAPQRPAAAPAASDDESALDLGAVLGGAPLVRVGGAVAVAALVVTALMRRRRHGVGFEIRYSW
jgi:carbon monoxide dehydrogenase subunit G